MQEAAWNLVLEPKKGEERFCATWQRVSEPGWVRNVFNKKKGAVAALSMKGRTTVKMASMQGLAMAAVDGSIQDQEGQGELLYWGLGMGEWCQWQDTTYVPGEFFK